MKTGIHPDYVETTVDLRLRQHVHHPQHREERPDPRRGLLAVPPVLHRQAEDPRQRRPRRPLREALRQAQERSAETEHSRQIAASRRPSCCVCRDRASVRVWPGASSSREVTHDAQSSSADRHARRVEACSTEHAELERQLADPDVHADPAAARKVGRRYAQLAPIVATYRKLRGRARRPRGRPRAGGRRRVVRRRGRRARGQRRPNSTTQLTDLLVPRDPHDADDILLEVKSGEGGEESALFAADLLRMYIRYAERHGWKVDRARRRRRPTWAATRTPRCRSRARATAPTGCGRG